MLKVVPLFWLLTRQVLIAEDSGRVILVQYSEKRTISRHVHEFDRSQRLTLTIQGAEGVTIDLVLSCLKRGHVDLNEVVRIVRSNNDVTIELCHTIHLNNIRRSHGHLTNQCQFAVL